MTKRGNLEKPRWIYRFDNFKQAFALLGEAINMLRSREVSQLEQEGIIQRFEYTWELIWKVLKDYLEHEGVVFETITPANVIKEAVAANLIKEGEVWMDALDARNKMSHTYDYKKFKQIVIEIERSYYPELENINLKMLKFAEEFESRNV